MTKKFQEICAAMAILLLWLLFGRQFGISYDWMAPLGDGSSFLCKYVADSNPCDVYLVLYAEILLSILYYILGLWMVRPFIYNKLSNDEIDLYKHDPIKAYVDFVAQRGLCIGSVDKWLLSRKDKLDRALGLGYFINRLENANLYLSRKSSLYGSDVVLTYNRTTLRVHMYAVIFVLLAIKLLCFGRHFTAGFKDIVMLYVVPFFIGACIFQFAIYFMSWHQCLLKRHNQVL
ncbi:MAG: hypothetical protein H6R01_1956 [Burkholderiaceae bacterium]|nr:hypothetical protein [Burkholderiaceae bacterium]